MTAHQMEHGHYLLLTTTYYLLLTLRGGPRGSPSEGAQAPDHSRPRRRSVPPPRPIHDMCINVRAHVHVHSQPVLSAPA